MTDEGLSAPHTKRGRLQRACLELLRQHERDGALPTSGRFIYYELVQSRAVSKQAKRPKAGQKGRRSDQDAGEALLHLREIGLIPWEWIVDETRSISVWRYAGSVAGYMADTLELARIDVWGGVPPPVIITESRSLSGVLDGLAREYLVPITATNGQVRGHLHTEVAPRLVVGQRVLYLGDFDWQGAQIEANTRRVLEGLIGGPLDWMRLAITAEQVRDANPPLPIIDKPDKRYKPVRYHEAVETEALGQSVIVGIVRDHLEALLPEPLDDVLEREAVQRRAVLEILQGTGQP